MRLVRQERERHAEDVDVLRLEQSFCFVEFIGDVRLQARPTTCSHSNWLEKARSPMMWVTVLASQPSESMPTEITFWICSPGLPDLAYGIDLTPELLRLLLLGQLSAPARRRPSSSSRSVVAVERHRLLPAASAISRTLESMCSVRSGIAEFIDAGSSCGRRRI